MSDEPRGRRTFGRRTVLSALGASTLGTPVLAQSGGDGADDGSTTFEATVQSPTDDQSLDRTDAVVDGDALADVGRKVGDQVRVRRADDALALFTVEETTDDEGVVQLSEGGRGRLGADDGKFEATVDARATDPDLDAPEAREAGELIERLDDPGTDEFFVSATHGGRIEPFTDSQGALFAYEVDADVTFWRCRGWNPDGNAFERWHVPTSELSPNSFPGLGEVADRDFQRGVSFQGIAADGIRVGGGAPDDLKESVVDAVESVVADDVPVEVARSRYKAESEDVLVNDAVADGEGLWIGQSFRAREDHWRDVVEAVAAGLGDA